MTPKDGQERIPLVGVGQGNGVGLLRTASCVSDPQQSALSCVKRQDVAGLSNILADVCPVDDDETRDEAGEYPLAEDHWINTPLGKDGDYKTLLHLALETRSHDMVRILVRAGARCDNHNDDLGVSPVHVAADQDDLESLKILMETGSKNQANINNMMRNGRTALHIAAEKGNNEILEYILSKEALDNVDAEDLMGRQTPLYLAAKNGHLRSVKLLLEHGASLKNTVNNQTIGEFLKEKFPSFNPNSVSIRVKPKENSINDILYSAAKLLDKAAIVKRRNQSNAQNLMFFKTLIQSVAAVDDSSLDTFDTAGMTLLQKSCDYGLDQFAKTLLENGVNANSSTSETKTKPILLAAYYGHDETLRVLLEHKKEDEDGLKTARLNVQDGHSKETILHYILKMPNKISGQKVTTKYKICLDLLLVEFKSLTETDLTKIINKRDLEGNSALHYATQNWSQSVVTSLLEYGANIGLKNNWDETPISKINPDIMEDFLDNFCLHSKNDVHQEDFELEFNYSFIAPPIDNPYFDETDPEGQELVENQGYPETETLWYMAQSKDHRHLLKHPVITSFLWMKWQRIRKQFNRNLRLYLLFVTTLTWYIFERFGGVSLRFNETDEKPAENKTTPEIITNLTNFCSTDNFGSETKFRLWYGVFWIQAIFQFVLIARDWWRDLKESDNCSIAVIFTSWLEYLIITINIILMVLQTRAMFVCLIILVSMVLFREGLQMMVSLKRYVFDAENWLELITLILTAVILLVPDDRFESPCVTKRYLAAFAIILSWSTLITLVGRHPKLSKYNVYVTMFYTILKTFAVFLVWYSFFLIAFSLGFYIMLHKDVQVKKDSDGEEEDYVFFDSPWLSLIKTATMFVGEIEFSDIPVDLENKLWPLGYVFLLSFIFLIGKINTNFKCKLY